MKSRILIAYASRHGSTQEIAEAMAAVLSGAGADVVTRHVSAVQSVEPFHFAIVGAPIYYGHWAPEAVEFLQRFRADFLAQRRLALFGVGIEMWTSGYEETLLDRAHVLRSISAVEGLYPAAVGVFAGAVRAADHTPEEREEIRRMGVPEGDFRNWGGIRQWALELGFHHPRPEPTEAPGP